MTGVLNQEDLAALFSRNLSLHPQQQYAEPTPTYVQSTENNDPPTYSSATANPISYSISQHYTHSAHITKAAQRSASEPISSTDQNTVEIILARHGVDIKTLFPSQIELFKSAEVGQQMRLIELWRISPPSYGGHALAPNLCTWQTTNFDQEESMAKMRYDRKMAEEQQRQWDHENAQRIQMTGMETNTIVPIQGGDGRWSGSDLPKTVQHTQEPEPYMQSGYEQLARREYESSNQHIAKDAYSHFGSAVGAHAYNQSTDPVYNIIPNSGPEWERKQQQAMEDQYGSYQAGIHVIPVGYGDDMDML